MIVGLFAPMATAEAAEIELFAIAVAQPAPMLSGGTQNLSALVSGATGNVTWSVVSGPGTMAGSVVTATGPGSIVVRATDDADSSFADATITASNLSFNGTPVMTAGTPLTLAVNPAWATVSWTFVGTPPTGATISGSTLNVPTVPTGGTVTVRATPTPGNSADFVITVNSAFSINVPAETRAPMALDSTRTLVASVPGMSPQPNIHWSIDNFTQVTGAPATATLPSISSSAGGSVLHTGSHTNAITIRATAFNAAGIAIPGIPPYVFTITVLPTRTVVFNLNGGTWPTTGLTQSAAGTLATAIDGVQTNGVPRRLGYTFNGWWTTATDTPTAGVQVNRETPLTLPQLPATGNIQLFARWTAAVDAPPAVPANSTVASVFPDANLAARVAASLNTTFNVTTITPSTRIFASDLAQIQTLILTRPATQPIVDLRGIPTLTGVRTVTPANGLAGQSVTLPAVARTFPLNHTNVLRDRLGAFVNPTTISNNGTVVANTNPANNTIRWTTVPATAASVTYTWHMTNVLIGDQNVTFSGTVTLPFVAAMNFVDVNINNWFYDAVNFVFDEGIMEGTSATTFEPNRNLTRAEVAVILYRMAGEPTTPGQPPFTDVTAVWQRAAVNWAAQNDIVLGIGYNLFAPDDPVTREQFAAMFHRFAVYSDVSVTIPGTANLNNFPDRLQVSNWALDYMRWATYTGLITGTTGGLLAPRGTTTRAECATIIQRFMTTGL